MSFYDDMAKVASQLLKEFGQPVTITRPAEDQNVDPVTGAVTGGEPTVYTVNGFIRPYPDHLVDGTRITTGDRLLMLEPAVEPNQADTITVQGQEWPIQNIKTINPAGTPVLFFVQVRR